jgi:alkanesulfonate monooxygenase SsuD/methylene tetrahydromethanopterin reductase-like flavin-dependent oxidoreductase (luciferase family)
VRFGLFGGALRTAGRSYEQTYGEYVDYLCAAEDLGYESAFLVEHHFTGLGDIGASLMVLGNLAARTTTLRLGTAVAVLPWHVPTLLAEQAATVDVLSGGRLDFGIGRGYRLNEFHGFCIDPAEATARFDECVEILELAWGSDERFSYDGAFWKLQDVVVEPRPVQRPGPPIWVAAGSQGSVTAAAHSGHRLLLDQFTDVDGTRQKIEWFRAGCEAAGRTYSPRDVALTRGLLIIDSDDRTRREEVIARRSRGIRTMAESARIPGTEHTQEHSFFDDSTETIEATTILGQPEECIERLQALADIGVEQVLLSDLRTDVDSLELFAKEVMPALQ